MTIKKLTVAAAIAVGIATCSFSSAMAACPLSGCDNGQMKSAPCTTCPTCGQNSANCGCPKTSPCDCNATPSCGCNTPASSCDKPAVPACATCPSTSCADLDMKQVYAYPNAIYGDNNYVGEQTNAIYSTETAWQLDCCDGLAASHAGLTGAAAPLGYENMSGSSCGCAISGVPVKRACAPKCNSCDCGCTGAAAPCGCEALPVINQGCGCGCTGAAAPLSGSSCGCDNLQSSSSMRAIQKSFIPFEAPGATSCASCATGAAAPLVAAFPDVPDGYWAACPIDKLAMNDVVVGYPDRLFKPGRDISRAEFATMMVKGYNLNCGGLTTKSLFKDVPRGHWANSLISKAVEEGIMCGYPDNKFKPKQPVTRVEALTAMSHGINCEMSCDKAQQILGQYCDGNLVPSWAQIPVAKALDSGALKTSLNPNSISPCKKASRAEIADMLQNTRIALGYDTNPATACSCPKPSDNGCPKKAYMENEEIIKLPTLKVKFLDEINAKSSRVGQQFAAKTTEDITLNGTCYPCGSRVNGKIVEVIRPSGCQKGALKVAFTNIEDCSGCKADLPRQILSAQINCDKKQNAVARFVAMPFTLVGSLVGTVGRTTGGMIANAGNAIESVSNGTGIALSETMQGQFRAAGRSLQDAGKEAIIAPVDFTRTALSGTMGLFQTTGDEVAYLVDPNGTKISAINPKEEVTVAFGCAGH